ncbi:PAS domain S-box protein [Streptomyces alanosinicus]|uniref:PAS fold domain-containing protein n=1 Tax=Streptomyces alanosinicus TaxID=68171 RepID=A0A918YSP3_9ACTN|nr:PAS domain S-box protein [Streptomyces alanosinicus]GHE14432.1 hypothetical protein GCM10010339_85090 [Streptomyces alanosinicus]
MDTPAAAAVAGPDGALTSWTFDAQQLLGYSAAQVIGRRAAGLLARPLPDTARRHLAAREGWGAPVTLRHRDGDLVHCTQRARPLVTGDERTGWLPAAALSQDGGAAADGEDRLLRWAFDQSPFALRLFDTTGRLVRISHRFERNAAATTQEPSGLRLSEALQARRSTRTRRSWTVSR